MATLSTFSGKTVSAITRVTDSEIQIGFKDGTSLILQSSLQNYDDTLITLSTLELTTVEE